MSTEIFRIPDEFLQPMDFSHRTNVPRSLMDLQDATRLIILRTRVVLECVQGNFEHSERKDLTDDEIFYALESIDLDLLDLSSTLTGFYEGCKAFEASKANSQRGGSL